jgi:hypothetical protein
MTGATSLDHFYNCQFLKKDFASWSETAMMTFYNKMLRKEFGRKEEEVTGGYK